MKKRVPREGFDRPVSRDDEGRVSFEGSCDPGLGEEEAQHRLERAVQRRLLGHPDLRFSSLVIRRIRGGVCLEGVLESSSDLDLGELVRSVAGVDLVLNHLVVRSPQPVC